MRVLRQNGGTTGVPLHSWVLAKPEESTRRWIDQEPSRHALAVDQANAGKARCVFSDGAAKSCGLVNFPE